MTTNHSYIEAILFSLLAESNNSIDFQKSLTSGILTERSWIGILQKQCFGNDHLCCFFVLFIIIFTIHSCFLIIDLRGSSKTMIVKQTCTILCFPRYFGNYQTYWKLTGSVAFGEDDIVNKPFSFFLKQIYPMSRDSDSNVALEFQIVIRIFFLRLGITRFSFN